MICQRCLRASLRHRQALPSSSTTTFPLSRTFTASAPSYQATPVTAETTTTTLPRSSTGAPAATATPGVTQPFSTPLQTSPKHDPSLPIQPKQPKQAARIVSSCAAGTVLKGLNFIKGQQDPLAKKDSEYPDWLWTVLNRSESGSGGATDGPDSADLFSKSKKQRRIAAKALRKLEAENPEALVKRVPVFEQSVDLSLGSGESVVGRKEAQGVREELTKAMRGERRRRIKEGNFLKAMA